MPYIPYYCRLQYSIILQLPKIKGTKSRRFCNATHKDIAVLRNDTLRSPIKRSLHRERRGQECCFKITYCCREWERKTLDECALNEGHLCPLNFDVVDVAFP